MAVYVNANQPDRIQLGEEGRPSKSRPVVKQLQLGSPGSAQFRTGDLLRVRQT